MVAARSYYTQSGESYAGLGSTELRGYETSLGSSEPADTVKPGDAGVNPQDIWIDNGIDGTNPTSSDSGLGRTVVLCSVSRGDSVYCLRDTAGVTSYWQSTAVPVASASSSLYALDGFTGSDNTLLDGRSSDSGHSWTQRMGAGNNARITDANRITVKAVDMVRYYSSFVPSSADYSVVCDVVPKSVPLGAGSGQYYRAGVVGRMSTSVPPAPSTRPLSTPPRGCPSPNP